MKKAWLHFRKITEGTILYTYVYIYTIDGGEAEWYLCRILYANEIVMSYYHILLQPIATDYNSFVQLTVETKTNQERYRVILYILGLMHISPKPFKIQ